VRTNWANCCPKPKFKICSCNTWTLGWLVGFLWLWWVPYSQVCVRNQLAIRIWGRYLGRGHAARDRAACFGSREVFVLNNLTRWLQEQTLNFAPFWTTISLICSHLLNYGWLAKFSFGLLITEIFIATTIKFTNFASHSVIRVTLYAYGWLSNLIVVTLKNMIFNNPNPKTNCES
jgi:hypothetical protein